MRQNIQISLTPRLGEKGLGMRPSLTSFRLSEGRIIFTNFFKCAKMRSCSEAKKNKEL